MDNLYIKKELRIALLVTLYTIGLDIYAMLVDADFMVFKTIIHIIFFLLFILITPFAHTVTVNYQLDAYRTSFLKKYSFGKFFRFLLALSLISLIGLITYFTYSIGISFWLLSIFLIIENYAVGLFYVSEDVYERIK